MATKKAAKQNVETTNTPIVNNWNIPNWKVDCTYESLIPAAVKSKYSEITETKHSTVEDVRKMIDQFFDEYVKTVQQKFQDKWSITNEVLITMAYYYEYIKQNPENLEMILTYNTTTHNCKITNMKFMKNLADNVDEFVQRNPETYKWNNCLENELGQNKFDHIKEQSWYDQIFWPFAAFYVFEECWNSTERCDDPKQIVQIENEELKALIIQARPEILDAILTVTDTYVHKKDPKLMIGTTVEKGAGENLNVYQLMEGTIARTKVKFVKCWCPSTDRVFLLGLEDKVKTAKDAIPSLCMIPKVFRGHVTLINRQGERYFLQLDEEMTKKLEDGKITKAQLEDIESINTEVYWNCIQYEY